MAVDCTCECNLATQSWLCTWCCSDILVVRHCVHRISQWKRFIYPSPFPSYPYLPPPIQLWGLVHERRKFPKWESRHSSAVNCILVFLYSSRATFLTQRRGVYDISIVYIDDRPTDDQRPTSHLGKFRMDISLNGSSHPIRIWFYG